MTTKGPWTADLLPGDCWRVISDGRVVADQIETKADADLIAAAPELAFELRNLLEAIELRWGPTALTGWHHDPELINRSRAALSKARGEP